MIELPQALKDHVGQDVTCLAYCWTIKRIDGVVFGFTDHDEAITIGGTSYDPQTGLSATAVEAELGLAVSTMEVEGALRSDKINENDLRIGKFNDAIVETLLVNWTNPAQHVLLRKARVGKIEFSGGSFKVELQSFTAALDKRRGRIMRRSCDAMLGDERCGKQIDTGAYQATGVVAAIVTQNDFVAAGVSSFETRWFEGGTIEWLSGSNVGKTSHVAHHDNKAGQVALSIWLPLQGEVVIGDSFRVTAGCDKAFQTCKEKFSNQLNFRGFPHLPGNDAVYAYVDGSGIFDGEALVK